MTSFLPYLPKPLVNLKYVYKNFSDPNMTWGDRRFYAETVKRELIRVATGVAAYVAAVKYGPRFGVDLPTAGCLMITFARQSSIYGIATHLLFSGMNNALNAGRAKNIQSCVVNLAISAMGYSMTTQALSRPVDKLINYTVGAESSLGEAVNFIGLGAYFGAVRQGPRFGIDLATASSSMLALWSESSEVGLVFHLVVSGLWNAVNAARVRNMHGCTTHLATAAMGCFMVHSETLSKPFEKFVEYLAPNLKPPLK